MSRRTRMVSIIAAVRPLVFPMGSIAEPPDGYATDDAKIAGGSATFTLPATLPAAPATVDGYEIVPADKALTKARVAESANPEQPIAASDVRLGQAEFTADRGPKPFRPGSSRFRGRRRRSR